MKITMPENDTTIQMNVSGKTVDEVGKELVTLGEIFKYLARGDANSGIGIKYNNTEEAKNNHVPMPHIKYREWDDDKESFSTNGIIRAVIVEGDTVYIDMAEDFIELAKTGKTIDEYCKEEMESMRISVKEQEK